MGTEALVPVLGEATDERLIAAVRAGDDAAFAELYRRYERPVRAFVRRRVVDRGRAEDLTQEAFLAALRRLRATHTEIDFRPWIYEIARNATIDQHRRATRSQEVSVEEIGAADRLRLVEPGPGPDVSLLWKERLDHLQGAFDELSASHHRILVLREFEGLSYREIGERMDLSRAGVESALFRARHRLEQEYSRVETGARCEAVRAVMDRLGNGGHSPADRVRLSRHVRRCGSCRVVARRRGLRTDALPFRASLRPPL